MYLQDNYQLIWESSVNGYYGYYNPYLSMQDDGTLVIYDYYYGIIWSTGTQQRNF